MAKNLPTTRHQMNLLISLFDRTGNWSRPYLEAEWDIIQIDIQNGTDISTWAFKAPMLRHYQKIVILAAVPCTDFAVSGAKHFSKKDSNGETAISDALVDRTKEIIDWFNPFAWAVENPKSRIHKRHSWLGQKAKHVFNPCDFAGYSPYPDQDRYNKETCLFGKFNDPIPKRLEPLGKEYPGFTNLGGKSLETKNARSITPMGFAYAFYEANH
jgi:hypothetical protein